MGRYLVRSRLTLLVLLGILAGCDVPRAYLFWFDVYMPRPAIFNQDLGCTGEGRVYMTTTAYLPTGIPTERRLLVMHRTRDGRSLVTTYDGHSRYGRIQRPIPAGTFRVLTVLVKYSETVGSNGLTLLSEAQTTVNAQHAKFARDRGLSSPIVRFDFTNVAVPRSDIPDPRSLDGVGGAVESTGRIRTVSAFDFVVAINPNPGIDEGGASYPGSSPPYFIYLGNFGKWRTTLTPADFASLAHAAYHHELGHYWGWEHDWTPECGGGSPFSPFITAPILFGWEDTDGDHIPEILDPRPYGT